MASTDARPIPLKAVAFRAVFPILDADGDLVTAASSPDSEVSKDQGTFTDCTNEATEIATSSGMYYLDLTSTEMTADCVAVIVKCGTAGAKTTVLVLYPQEAGDSFIFADDLLNRDMSLPSDSVARSPLNALRAIRNKVSVAAGVMTVTKENDSTSAWTAAVTSTAGADPITAIDPA
jgi:hypothetical protein